MPPKSFVIRSVLLALSIACSRSAVAPAVDSWQTGDDRRFVPQGLSNTNIDGQDDGLTLVAFTLTLGPAGPELYAAVRNDGSAPACEAGMVTDFYDKDNQRLTSAGSVLLSGRFYRLDDSTTILCVDPGQIAMTATTGLPDNVVIDELGSLTHLFPSFTLAGAVPITGLEVREVRAVTVGGGQAYTGKLVNELDIPAGASWTFETGTVGNFGVGYSAFSTASTLQ